MCEKMTKDGVWLTIALTQKQLETLNTVITYLNKREPIPEGMVQGFNFNVTGFRHSKGEELPPSPKKPGEWA